MEMNSRVKTETIYSNKCIENHLQQKKHRNLWRKRLFTDNKCTSARGKQLGFTDLMMTKQTYELTVLHLCSVTKILLFQLQPKGTYKEKQNNDLWQTSSIGTTCQRTKQYKANSLYGFLCTTMCGVQHSSSTDIPFKRYTAEIRRKPPAHPWRILGRCILTIGEPVIMMLTQSCGVYAEKKIKKTKQNNMQGFSVVVMNISPYLTHKN